MYTLISPGDHLRITCDQTDWTRSNNNVINIPRTRLHPTPPHTPPRPVAEHDTTWSSAAEQHTTTHHPTPPPTPTWSSAAEQHATTPHPTPPHPPPHPALSRSMIQRDHLQRSKNRCAVIGEPGSPRVCMYIYIYIYIYMIIIVPLCLVCPLFPYDIPLFF